MGITELKKHKYILVSGIGTEVGKTVCSATITGLLNAEYWKPVQAGGLDESDSIFVGSVVGKDKIHKEAFALKTPCSPHEAARIDGVEIDLMDLKLPMAKGTLVVEGAGGLMVPVNNKADNYIDFAEMYDLPVVLVVRHYLGSINHTLLSIQALMDRGITLLGLVVSGESSKHSEEIIETKFPGTKILLRVPEFNKNNLIEDIKTFIHE